MLSGTKRKTVFIFSLLILLVATNYGSFHLGKYVKSMSGDPAGLLFSYHPIVEHLPQIQDEKLLWEIRNQISNAVFQGALSYNDYSDRERSRIQSEFKGLDVLLKQNNMTLSELVDIKRKDITSEEKNSMLNYMTKSFHFILDNEIHKNLPYVFEQW